MIGRIRGTLEAVQGAVLLVETRGVGYEIAVSAPVLAQLPARGELLTLHLHYHVGSDQQPSLLGFDTQENRDVFRLLLGVKGVGPKAGLAIMSMFDRAGLTQAIAAEAVDRLTAVPGIGRKGALQIILDLKSKLVDQPAEVLTGATASAQLRNALLGLGFSDREIAAVAAKVDPELSLQEQIRTALRSMGQ